MLSDKYYCFLQIHPNVMDWMVWKPFTGKFEFIANGCLENIYFGGQCNNNIKQNRTLSKVLERKDQGVSIHLGRGQSRSMLLIFQTAKPQRSLLRHKVCLQFTKGKKTRTKFRGWGMFATVIRCIAGYSIIRMSMMSLKNWKPEDNDKLSVSVD